MMVAGELSILPLLSIDLHSLQELLTEEQQDWLNELYWDNTEVQKIITHYISRSMLPGFAAVCSRKVIGYTYYTIYNRTGFIGTLYVSKDHRLSTVPEKLLSTTVDAMKCGSVQRLEAQIFPFGIDIVPAFLQLGFKLHRRCYLCKEPMDIEGHRQAKSSDARAYYRLEPWSHDYIEEAGKIIHAGYAGSADTQICQEYSRIDGCITFMRNLTVNPGCGTFTPEASFVAFDPQGRMCGVVVAATISKASALIPQISVLPEHQSLGIGKMLMDRAMRIFCQRGYRRICLSVTEKNAKAFQWYMKLGFKPKKELLAFAYDCGLWIAD